MRLQRVAVLGGGTMGRGIAQVAAQAGWDVVLRDVDEAALGRALDGIRQALDVGVQKGKVTAAQKDATLARIRTDTDATRAVKDTDLVIEAVPEDLELKRRVFRDVEAAVPAHTVLASNTSSLSISAIAAATRRPERVVGMHFFNPPHLLKLLEVVKGERTDEGTLQTAVEAARRMGKEPIVVKDSPGFASSRLGVALGLEAMRMLEAGVASAADIDKAMELGYNHPMGPLKLTDLVGLDVRLAIAEHLHKTLGSEAFRPPEVLRRLVREGKLGRKSGEGFFRYEGR